MKVSNVDNYLESDHPRYLEWLASAINGDLDWLLTSVSFNLFGKERRKKISNSYFENELSMTSEN